MAIDHLTEIFRFYSFTVLHDQLIIQVFQCVTWTMNINMNLWSVETAELERIQREGNSSGKDYIFPVIGMVFSHPKDGIFPKNEIFSIPRMAFFKILDLDWLHNSKIELHCGRPKLLLFSFIAMSTVQCTMCTLFSIFFRATEQAQTYLKI